ncbi:hypothetical protein O9H85_17190 [Paenibacillus filicis]|uniref:PepSY domain-containing protein n=1 Tax=Paenibacillus gyeongsangnamensis TaxID=3388067 RepID=A0ABT4QB63_9BACL|nr:PepSY domain-containing protein [Paenibacillus filicis]MCZ8514129.1 hypothetical protein [Paenibacillus filicis]
MKKKLNILIMTMAIVSICSIGVAMAQPNISESTVQTSHDISRLAKEGVKLKKTIDNPTITQAQAIDLASKYAQGYAQEAKQIIAEYHLLSNDKLTLFSDSAKEKNPKLKIDGKLNDTPVYIVTFKGITKKGHVSSIKQKVPVNHEYNLVIDANSGEVLYGFSYR